MHPQSGYTVFTRHFAAEGRGARSGCAASTPRRAPVIDHSLLGHPDDLARLIAGLKQVERVLDAPALARRTVGRNVPETPPKSDAEWEDLVRTRTAIGYHPVGTCRMGSDEASVVDLELRVRAVSGPARRRRLGHPPGQLCQHQRAHHHGRGAGGRHHSQAGLREHAAWDGKSARAWGEQAAVERVLDADNLSRRDAGLVGRRAGALLG